MSDAPHTFDATIVITTKNRSEDLRRAVTSALQQTGCRIEILVIDDGSDDGTADMVRHEFPAVRLERSEQSMGYIVQRNRSAKIASAPIIVSLDDDASFSGPTIVLRTIQAFSNPRIGAVAIPFINVRYDSTLRQVAPDAANAFAIESYIGTAHAVRREQFVQLEGYREQLFHQCEEEDYCIRLLDAGYFVCVGSGEPIHHYESPRRDVKRVFVFNARNHVLFAWQNIPMPYCPIHLLATMINLLRYGIRRRRLGWTVQGIFRGWKDALKQSGERRPVTRRTYRLSRWIKKNGPVLLTAAIEKQ